MWNETFHKFLIDNGFVRSDIDYCLYNSKNVKLIIFVDDIIACGAHKSDIETFIEKLKNAFKMSNLGQLEWFLGIEICQQNGYITMGQSMYVNKLLNRYDMQDCRELHVIGDNSLLNNDVSNYLPDNKQYRSLIGSLIYLMVCTRPDICYIVSKLSCFLEKPTENNWLMAKNILRYLKYTKDYKLTFSKNECIADRTLRGYCDASWASGSDDRRSVTGYCFVVNPGGCTISWKSRKQPTVALSTTEAEYMALTEATKEALYLRSLLSDIDEQYNMSRPVVLYEDNQGAMALVKNPVFHNRTKHIDVRFHFIREHFTSGHIDLEYVCTENMVADCLTKLVTKAKQIKCNPLLFGI